MPARMSSLALAIMAALCLGPSHPSVAQTAALKPATPLAATAQTAVPALIPFTGAAVTADGKPLTGDSSITFLIYKEESGGEALFAESQTVALDPAGHYKAQLGATLPNGIPIDLFATGEARWLEVQIAGQPPQPRVLLVSVPYALKAGDASTLGGLPASAYALAGSKTSNTTAVAPAGTSAIGPDAVSNVTTTGGTSGYVPLFNGASTIADSILFQNATGIGIGDVPNATLDVNGKSIWRGNVNLARTGNATPTQGTNSFPFSFNTMAYNSSLAANVSPVFYWQAEAINNNTPLPGATMNLLYNKNSGTGVETGLYFNANGIINFAPGQTFPGAGGISGVTSGLGLTGGGTSGNVTLSLDTTKVPLLSANNTFAGSQYFSGSLTSASAISALGALSTSGQLVSTLPTGTAPLSVNSTTQVPNLNASLLGGFPSNAFITTTASNTFTGTQNFTRVGIGTATPRSQLEISSTAPAALGSVITLTNTAGTTGAENALDFNSVAPLTTGTYNPMARIAAVDALQYSDNIVFQTNKPGARNNGLQTNMTIQSTGNIVMPNMTLLASGALIANGSVSTAGQLVSTIATGTAPLSVNSTTQVANLNASLLGGFSASSFVNTSASNTFTGNQTISGSLSATGNISTASRLVSTVATGTAPLSVNSTTVVPNLNASLLGGLSAYSFVSTTGVSQSIVGSLTQDGPYPALKVEGAAGVYSGSDALDPTGGDGSGGGSGISALGGSGYGLECSSGDSCSGGFGGTGGMFLGGDASDDDGVGGNGIYASGGEGGTGGSNGTAGVFNGPIYTNSSLSTSATNTRIDHPLDPANKYLVQSSVQSSEMMNIYSGNVVTDELGLATIKLPTWFEAENADFRYQLTTIGRDAHAWIAKEVGDHQFQIATNATNVKVSWQITAVRQDAYAKANPMVAEQPKPANERGFYVHPELYGQPAEKQTEWGRHPQQMQRLKDQRLQQQLKAKQRSARRLSSEGNRDQLASAIK